jgi:hypothetical protein
MRGSVAAGAGKANGHPDARVGMNGRPRRLVGEVVRAARALWPRKLSANLSAIAEVEQRTAERWLAGTQDMSADALARLIRSEHGMEFLAAIMADAPPRWWGRLRATSKVAAMRREQLRIQEALHEAEQLAATLARAETALAVSDEDFHRESIDALGSMRRGLAGSLAR